MPVSALRDVLAVGNAIVDIVAQADDAFLDAHSVIRARMSLVERDQAVALTEALQDTRGTQNIAEMAGGSAANTAVGIASLGGTAAFLGKCADDRLGTAFRTNLAASGIEHLTPPGPAEPPTGRSVVLVTPDHERSMTTYPGAAATMSVKDVDAVIVKQSRIVLIEGYLFYSPPCAEALLAAARAAKEANITVALALSDPLCVKANREAMRNLVDGYADILIANEAEVLAYYEIDDFGEAAERAASDAAVVILTRGEKGAVLLRGGERAEISARPVPSGVTDVTGAGDAFAAGALFALAKERSLADAAALGALCASEAVSHYGARPETSLRQLAHTEGLLPWSPKPDLPQKSTQA